VDSALAILDPEKVADRYAPDAVLLPIVSNEVRTYRAGIVDYFDRLHQMSLGDPGVSNKLNASKI
jgi:hypothetical protein